MVLNGVRMALGDIWMASQIRQRLRMWDAIQIPPNAIRTPFNTIQ